MLAVEEVAERFLDDESKYPLSGVDPAERVRFQRLVRQCAANWLLHPRAGLRMTRGKTSATLHFEGPLGGKVVSVFALRINSDDKEYRFVGPNADRKKLGLAPASLIALDRLRDLYDAFLPEKETGESVAAVIRGNHPPDLVPLVEETRRALDGGLEVAAGSHMTSTKKKSAAATAAARAAAPADAGATNLTKPAPQPPANASPAKSNSTNPREPQPIAAPAREPEPKTPNLTYLMLACPDPKASAAFFNRIFQLKPARKTRDSSYVEFRLGAVTLALQEDLTREERKLYGFGAVERHRGWGALFVLQVSDFDLCLRRARRLKDAVVHEVQEARSFVVRDPAGYLLEITELK